MTGDDSLVRCPVHRVEITPCDAAELAPLLAHLGMRQAVQGALRFPRGTLVEDGRLDLCKQRLGTANCIQLTQVLEGNTNVRSLMLGTDAIGDDGAHAVGRLVSCNPHLEVLYLGCNNIGPEGARGLSAALAQSEHVTGLWLKRNPLGLDGIRHIARMLRHNRRLRVLDLVNTYVCNEGLSDLVDALCSGNSTLSTLYLSGNSLDASAAACLGRLLREAPQVEALYLSVNRLQDAGAATLAEALGSNHTLRTLELASNGIGPSGAKALFAAVRQHPRLETLSLGYAQSTRALGMQANVILDEGAAEAARLLAVPGALRSIDLRRNGITAAGAQLLGQAALGNDRLIELGLDGGLCAPVKEHLARNLALAGPIARCPDQALIKSVYR